MLKTALLEKYRNGDFIQYINNVLTIITEEKATALNITEQRTLLQTSINELNNIWTPNKGSELTAQLVTLDKLRDSLFSGLKMTVDVWSKHHYDESKKELALLVSNSINSHGKDIIALRYQQETAVLNAILNDLLNEIPAAVLGLGLMPWVVELQLANKEFDALYVNRAIEISGTEKGIVDTKRTLVTGNFKTLKQVFEARKVIAQIEESDVLADFNTLSNEWSTLTQQYNDAITRATSNTTVEASS